ncbi:carbon-nitrogen hydrolase [Candidatus Woesearchaeota archaeon]|jgi:N-carbamoylputrescine amidase|nr:carbon-nitrogen hydrolase [Candidatus Woesearchaeota archaeon]MDP6940187.1 nitrilase-related carbon-nitrogen hydrolase [Planctomycetota bacterium]
MNIALIQQPAGPDVVQNLARGLEAARQAAQAGAQVICFAELAFEPFYPQVPAREQVKVADVRELAETIPGPMTEAFQAFAAEHGVVVILNLYERDGDYAYDTSPVIDADGQLLGCTRMVHITEYQHFHEQGYYDPGDQGAPVYETRYGKLGVAICYDRHFPEYLRALALGGAEVIFVPQAGAVGEWPDGLYEAEMQVAAFQNGVFTALCNRVGEEEKLTFAGESFICDPAGRVVARAQAGCADVLHAELDLSQIGASHGKKLFIRDRRPELYRAWL